MRLSFVCSSVVVCGAMKCRGRSLPRWTSSCFHGNNLSLLGNSNPKCQICHARNVVSRFNLVQSNVSGNFRGVRRAALSGWELQKKGVGDCPAGGGVVAIAPMTLTVPTPVAGGGGGGPVIIVSVAWCRFLDDTALLSCLQLPPAMTG